MLHRLSLTVLAIFTLFAGSAAMAQDANTRVLVPDAPNGALVSGCFQADRNLYGQALTFCLERRGTYQIRGNGVRCDGRLDWNVSGAQVNIDLRRQSCNRGVAWAAASITCRPQGLLDKVLTDIFRRQNRRVLVPDVPVVGALRCTYHPTVPGNRQQTFVARRLR